MLDVCYEVCGLQEAGVGSHIEHGHSEFGAGCASRKKGADHDARCAHLKAPIALNP